MENLEMKLKPNEEVIAIIQYWNKYIRYVQLFFSEFDWKTFKYTLDEFTRNTGLEYQIFYEK